MTNPRQTATLVLLWKTSKSKVKRAYHHIRDLNDSVTDFVKSDFYSCRIERDADGTQYLVFDFKRHFPDHTAVLVGDVLHNLRSALDILWSDIIEHCGGTVGDGDRFPLGSDWKSIKGTVDKTLSQKAISEIVRDHVADTIHANQTGNPILAALSKLNVLDKHFLLIPVHPNMMFHGIYMEDDNKALFMFGVSYFVTASGRVRLDDMVGDVHLKNYGKPAATVIFSFKESDIEFTFPYQNEPIIPSLLGIAEEVTRTVKSFESLLFGECNGWDEVQSLATSFG